VLTKLFDLNNILFLHLTLYMLYSSLSVLYEVAMYVVNVDYDTSIAKRIYGCVYH